MAKCKSRIGGERVNVRMTFLWQATVEQRKLAVDLAEVIVKWECQRMKEEPTADAVPQVNKQCTNVDWCQGRH